jgi:transketolase
VVTVEEHGVTGGLGSAVADVLAGVTVGFFKKHGVPDELYHQVGSQEYMRQLLGDPFETVVSSVRSRRAA